MAELKEELIKTLIKWKHFLMMQVQNIDQSSERKRIACFCFEYFILTWHLKTKQNLLQLKMSPSSSRLNLPGSVITY